MKKTMTMLLTAAMILSMSVTAFAAEAKYSVSVDDDLLTVNNGETKATYQLEDSKLSLSKSNDGGIALSFRTEDEGGKKVTLGEQKDVSISGDIDYLNISQTLDKDYTIQLDEDADIKELYYSHGPGAVRSDDLTGSIQDQQCVLKDILRDRGRGQRQRCGSCLCKK